MNVLVPSIFRNKSSWLAVLAGASLLLWFYSYLAVGFYDSSHFDGFIANGPFQMFNPLRRLAAGQTPGVDFQFFHGLGVPLLHYPIFALFGKTIFASEISRNLTSLIAYVAAMYVFGYAATNRNWKSALIFLSGSIYFLEVVGPTHQGPVNLLATPGNSILGLRSTMPLLFFSVLLFPLNAVVKSTLAGALLAAAILCGTEHGLALAAATIGIGALAILNSFLSRAEATGAERFPTSRNLILMAVSFACSLLLIYFLISGRDGMFGALKYNLVSVPSDQFWYFGAPPNDFAATPGDLIRMGWRNLFFFAGTVIWLAVILVTFFRRRDLQITAESFAIATMLFYGVISCASCLGMMEKAYLAPLYRIATLAILTIACRNDWISKGLAMARGRLPLLRAALVATGLCVVATRYLSMAWVLVSSLPPAPVTPWNLPAIQLSITWTKHLRDAEQVISSLGSSRPVIWSTYAGLLEDQNKVFHPREDYIIHALGVERRAAYLEAFRRIKPDLVQSIRRDYFYSYTRSHDYEQWLRNTSWDFYEDVINNYDPIRTTDKSIFWKRKSADWMIQGCDYESVRVDGNTIELPVNDSSHPEVAVIQIRYETSNPWRRIPFIGGLPRYLVTMEGEEHFLPVALPPYLTELRFPVTLPRNVKTRLRIDTRSLLPGANISIKSAGFRALTLPPGQLAFLTR